jgi:hypothetical protein
MVFYRLLSASDLNPLYDCFLEAFSDYQVDMRMSREQFEQRIVGGKCVGYGVVFRPSGNLMQLAVAREFRRRGIGSRILSSLSTNEALKVNNIDEKLTGTLAFFKANKFKIVLKQYEMLKNL